MAQGKQQTLVVAAKAVLTQRWRAQSAEVKVLAGVEQQSLLLRMARRMAGLRGAVVGVVSG
jgi:hypothetical protein